MAPVLSVVVGWVSEHGSPTEFREVGSVGLIIASSIAEMGWMRTCWISVLSEVVSKSEADVLTLLAGSKVVMSKSTSVTCAGKDSLGVERASSCFSSTQARMAGSCLQVISISGEASESSSVPEPEPEPESESALVLVLPFMLLLCLLLLLLLKWMLGVVGGASAACRGNILVWECMDACGIVIIHQKMKFDESKEKERKKERSRVGG